jgi:hypothetical protein
MRTRGGAGERLRGRGRGRRGAHQAVEDGQSRNRCRGEGEIENKSEGSRELRDGRVGSKVARLQFLLATTVLYARTCWRRPVDAGLERGDSFG